ncbi:MAG: chromosome segregation ATPase [Spirulinaceae cyanobacterium]
MHSVLPPRSRTAAAPPGAQPPATRPTNSSKFVQAASPQRTAPLPQPAPPTRLVPNATTVAEPDAPRLGLSWQWLAAGIVVISSILGFGSAAVLLKLPTLPNCPRMFLPTASASVRLYCAQLAANKGTREDLLEAVHLIEGLPQDHPLRPEIDRYLEDWVGQLLDIADETFQTGELDNAIALAQELEQYVESEVIAERIGDWQALWEKAEAIEAEARAEMKKGAWGKAFQAAGRLTQLDNRYWATTRYDELYQELTVAREEGKKLDEAFAKLNRGGLENLLAAIAAAEKIPPESAAHAEAQTIIEEGKKKLIDLAVRSLKRGDWQTAMQIVNRIPTGLRLQDEIDDLTLLADAASVASLGSQINLEDAMLAAQKIEPGRPLYSHAQALIKQWQSTISAGLKLDSAIELAREGTIQALSAAIAEARSIGSSNPRYEEAQRRIRDWQQELERLQDQPILDRAESFAFNGNLTAAIAEARKIREGRALYGPAQQRIQDWQRQLAATSDRPTSDQPSNSPGQSNEAQSQSPDRQAEQQAQELMNQAERQARAGTPEGLSAAIQTASQVSPNSPQASRAQERIDSWSSQLLDIARNQAPSNLNEAIRIARMIPARSSIYNNAQRQVAAWERVLSSGASRPESLPAQQ